VGQVLIICDGFCYSGHLLKLHQERKSKVCFQLPGTTILFFFFKVTKTVLLLIGEEEGM
jgi:hypothetical protein